MSVIERALGPLESGSQCGELRWRHCGFDERKQLTLFEADMVCEPRAEFVKGRCGWPPATELVGLTADRRVIPQHCRDERVVTTSMNPVGRDLDLSELSSEDDRATLSSSPALSNGGGP